ncbi:HpcH/HpaI aldolase/citrate lyase family protein [Chloroflexota bacterium]
MAKRIRRSGLMMPINTPRFVNNSWRRNSDTLDYDVEDSVPQSQKAYARSIIREVIPIGLKGGAEVGLRINCACAEADVKAAVWPGLSRIWHPKTEHAEQVRKLDELITRFERERGIRPGTVEIYAMIETALGVANAYEFASASPRVRVFGGATGYDMSLDMGIDMFVGFDQFVYNRGECELVAHALGLEPRVGVFTGDTTGGSVSDAEGVYLNALATRKAGGRSGGGLHPNVVEPQNRGFTPSPEEVEEAQRVLDFFRELDQRGEAEGELEGWAVDKYEAARAAGLIEWAELCAQRDAEKARAREETIAREEPPLGMRE